MAIYGGWHVVTTSEGLVGADHTRDIRPSFMAITMVIQITNYWPMLGHATQQHYFRKFSP